MRHWMRNAVAVLACVGSIVGCAHWREGMEGPTLRVGVTPDSPPVIFEKNGSMEGIEADLARVLADRLNRPLLFVSLPWEQQIDALVDGKVDIVMSGMSITDARRIRIAFCDPYMQGGLMALMRRDDAARYDSVAKVHKANSRIGFQRDTTGEKYVQEFCARGRKVPYSLPDDAALDLRRNRLDLFVHDAPVIWWMVSKHESDLTALNERLTEEPIAWGVSRDQPELVEAANRALAEMTADGTLRRILARWVPFMNRDR